MSDLQFDYRKLRGKIVEKGDTLEQFSKEVGISRTALYQKMNKDGEFTTGEMFNICEVLNIHVNQVGEYFFVESVR